ncbi:MAG: hypothetical protein ACC641_09930 [Acidiferrobacterales bacterium]
MRKNKYSIEIYEPGDYDGPHPLYCKAIEVIGGPERSKALLLDLTESLNADGAVCNQVVVRSRHDDPIDRVVNSPSTVVVYCVKPDQTLTGNSEYKYTEVINWGIGKISPLENGKT